EPGDLTVVRVARSGDRPHRIGEGECPHEPGAYAWPDGQAGAAVPHWLDARPREPGDLTVVRVARSGDRPHHFSGDRPHLSWGVWSHRVGGSGAGIFRGRRWRCGLARGRLPDRDD